MDPGIGRCHRGRLIHGSNYDVIMTNYRDAYLNALESSTWDDTSPRLPLHRIQLPRRIRSFFNLIGRDG